MLSKCGIMQGTVSRADLKTWWDARGRAIVVGVGPSADADLDDDDSADEDELDPKPLLPPADAKARADS